MDVTVEGVTTSPSIASSTTAQTALSESSLEPIYSQTTTDDSEDQVLTDSPFMFSTSMAPSSSSDSPSSQHVTAITEDLGVDDSVTALADVRNVSETQDYGVHLVSTTAGPDLLEIPSDKSEDKNGIDVGTIPPDVLISAPSSTEPMFALGKTVESILEKDQTNITSDLMHTSPDLTVEPTELISTFGEVSQSSTTKDDTILPNITTAHLTTVTDISPTEKIQSTVFDNYESRDKDTVIGVMAGPPTPQMITEVSDISDGLSTVPVTTDATVTFTTDTAQPSTTHSDDTTSASSIETEITTPVLAEKSDSTISTVEESVSCSSEVPDEVATKDIPTVTSSLEKSNKKCKDISPVQVIIINVDEQNETGKTLLIFCLLYPVTPIHKKQNKLFIRALIFS